MTGEQCCAYFQDKIFKGGCKKGVLMQYKCMEKEIRKLHGRILFPFVMYIANIPAGMQLCQIGNPRISVYRLLIFPPRLPGAQGGRNEFCRFVKKYGNIKSTDTILCSMSPHSRTTRAGWLQDFPVCSALPPDFWEALIHSQSLLL